MRLNQYIPELLSVVVPLVLSGTATFFLFTNVLVLRLLRILDRCVQRVVVFPSGLRRGELDFLGGGGGSGGGSLLGLGLRLAVCRWEDTEGDRDAGFKVQIDGLGAQEN